MTCWHETAFAIEAPRIVFGHGALSEAGDHARALGCKRVALFTDPRLKDSPHVAAVLRQVDAEVYAEVNVEPTDVSFRNAARFAAEGRFDGYISVGGGSVIDTCKAAALYATHPAEFLRYVNKPVGEGAPVPGALPPHIACPTTCGTGSETTGIAVCDVLSLRAKTGIASPRLRPTLALVDPSCTATLPAEVVAASGFDVLCHALESYTARPFTARAKGPRPMSQGANPWSDMGSREALRLCGAHLVEAVQGDLQAREKLSWAATLAGIAFGNAGVHVPHAMAYSVAGLVREFRMSGYPQDEPMVPHGVSVVVSAPAAFRFTASACPERHLEAAALLGADLRGATPNDAGELVARALEKAMQATRVPNGIGAVGYTGNDLSALTKGAFVQQRLLGNSPRDVSEADLGGIFTAALRYW
ncbi:MAG: iron-containing alcohol dehydrogenase [Myxococcales bacterium]|nr:iron-containing alcohol dehydrogenase [Myxococcales bacterium]